MPGDFAGAVSLFQWIALTAAGRFRFSVVTAAPGSPSSTERLLAAVPRDLRLTVIGTRKFSVRWWSPSPLTRTE